MTPARKIEETASLAGAVHMDTIRRTKAAQRQQHLDALYWEAYRAAQYRKFGTNEVPPGLDAGEREIYDAGLAGGDADRRAA